MIPTSRRTKRQDGFTQTYRHDLPDEEEMAAATGIETWKHEMCFLPFHEKGLLFEMLADAWRNGEIELSREPAKPTFYIVLRRPGLAERIVFLKHCVLGRCPECVYYKALIQRTIGSLRVPSSAAGIGNGK